MIAEIIYQFKHLDQLVVSAGYAGLFAIVFAETGLLAGFFLPGDSLLVTAGLMASQGILDISLLNLILAAAAISGDSTGYLIGHAVGPRLFKKQDSVFFKKEYLERTHHFFEKYGGKTIVLARFVPIVRTFAPTVAGAGRMAYRQFLFFNVIGGLLWVLGMTWIGFYLGRLVPNIEKHLHWVIVIVIVVSFYPIVHEALRSRQK